MVPCAHGLLTFMKDMRRDENVAQHTQKPAVHLAETWVKFAIEFRGKHESCLAPSTFYNVDETAIYFDTLPKYILTERDRKGTTKIK
ncbi:hypothetical protein JG687_00007576 [Phytophthora cactorum]|uniref:Uncharacterized protein n=1 Tax=Phytophthora cactorum TaxID=29920 RepID=A0A8T1UJX9_9STRA|nr:hypothetical protein JG687_00007576 [Phytophthora cactorum]